RARVLAKLADRVPEELMAEALAAIREAGELPRPADISVDNWKLSLGHDQEDALAALVPKLPEPLLAEALAVVQSIKAESYRVRALATLAPRLAGPLVREALAAAQDLKDEDYYPVVLAALGARLPGASRARTLQKAFRETENPRESLRSWVLAG